MLKEILDEHPGPYTFSKALGEYLITEEGWGIPTVIVRPPLVSATFNDPLEVRRPPISFQANESPDSWL